MYDLNVERIKFSQPLKCTAWFDIGILLNKACAVMLKENELMDNPMFHHLITRHWIFPKRSEDNCHFLVCISYLRGLY